MIPDLSVLWVIFFVLLMATILNSLLFKPLIRVMAAREAAVASARQLAERAATQAREATEEFDARTREARECSSWERSAYECSIWEHSTWERSACEHSPAGQWPPARA